MNREIKLFCPKCGKRSRPGARYCKYCGAELRRKARAARRRALPAVLLALALLALIGAYILSREASPSSVSVTIPSEGSIAIGPHGMRLEFPPQADMKSLQVTMAEVANPPQPEAGVVFASPAYEIEAGVEVLPAPAKLTLPLFPGVLEQCDEKTLLTVACWDGSRWIPLGGEVDEQNNTITVEVRHFSLFSTIRTNLPFIPLSTEHFWIFQIFPPEGYTIEHLAERLEKAWDLIIEESGYEMPIQSKMGQKVQAWIIPWIPKVWPGPAGEVGKYFEWIRERLLAYANYDIYLNWNLKDTIAEVTPAHEFFHIVQINSYLHPYRKEELGPVLWWMEATATWMGAKALGEREYMEHQRFYKMESGSFLVRSLDSPKGYQCYRAGAFVRYLEEKYGAEVIKETWTRLRAKRPPLQAVDEALTKVGSSLSEAYFDFALQYAYLRESEWLRKTMELPSNAPEPRAATIEVGTERKVRTIRKGHLTGEVFALVPASGTQGTLKLGFDWSADGEAWRVKLFAEKSDGGIIAVDVASLQAEYELPQFGREIKRLTVVVVNSWLGRDDATMGINYSIQMPVIRVITSGLQILQSPPYYVGQTITAEFTITNKEDTPLILDVLTVGGRLNGGCPDNVCPDFNWHRNVTLDAQSSYDYQGDFVLTQPGSYHFFTAYRTADGQWNTSIPAEPGVIRTLDIVVTEMPSPKPVPEGPAIEWSRTFGGANDDEGWSVQQTSDGGYIVVGYTASYRAGASDVWLIKTDAHGNKVWDRTFGSADDEMGCSVRQTYDGGYIIVGYTSEDVLLIKTDAIGNKVWDRTFGEPNYREKGYSVQQTSDGGYIIIGMTSHGYGYSPEDGKRKPDVLLIKTDAEGNQIWSRTFGDVGWDEGHWVQQTSDGGYIVAGETWSFAQDSSYDVWLIKTDSNGNKVWDRTFGEPGYNEGAFSVQQTSDGGYIIGGCTETFGDAAHGKKDIWLIKTDAKGNKVWDRTFGGVGFDAGVSVQQTSDGGCILVGYTESYGAGEGDAWLIKTDANGNKVWDKPFGGAGYDVGVSVQQTSDGGYIIAGSTESYRAGKRDVWLIKVGSGMLDMTPTTPVTPTPRPTPSAVRPKPAEPIKIGHVAPLTGDIPRVGEEAKYSLEMWLEDIEKAGGLDVGGVKYKVEVIHEDNESDGGYAAAAAKKLCVEDKVLAIIGAYASKQAIPTGEVADANETPCISPWSTNPRTTKHRPWVFRTCFLDPFQGPVVAKFATEEFGFTKAAVLYDVASDYPKALAEFFKDAWEEIHGPGSVVAFETFTTKDRDFSAQLTKIKGSGAEFFFTPQYYDEIPLIVKQAHELGLPQIIVGSDSWGSRELMPLCGDDCAGYYFSTHYAAAGATGPIKEFIDRYTAKYGYVPDEVAALTWDTALIVQEAIEDCGRLTGDLKTDRKCIGDAMANIKDFDGITGKMTFTEEGDPIKCAPIVKINEDHEFEFYRWACP